MSEVLHAAWLPALRRLFVWGELADAPPPKGRRAKLPAHPFLCTPEHLGELFAPSAPLAEHTATIWLPSAAGRPLPSPELLAMGAPEPPGDQPELAAWRVAGLLAPIDPALDLLLAAPAGSYGADLLAWRMAALLASEILAGQQVLPALEREGFGLRAAWQIRPAPASATRLAELARAMPPLCRAAVDDPSDAPPARALLDDFLAAAVDATIRGLPDDKGQRTKDERRGHRSSSVLRPSSTPAEKWLAALTGPSPQLDMRGAEADALFKAWQAWAGQGQAAGDETFRITFRLEPPERADQPWALDFLLRATDDPSLLVPAGQIWRERGASFSYLDRRFDHPQERMLAGLGYAARLSRRSRPACASAPPSAR